MADADICESEILKQSSRSIIRRDDLDNSMVKPARNNNYLQEESSRSKIRQVDKSNEMVCDNSDEEMLVELDMDEFKINRL
jgi:hypothetical protein